MVIIWRYSSSPSSYVSSGQRVVVPEQRCPTCQRWLVGWGGYWRWLRAPLLVERIWIRRARCAACRRSHALLPDLLLIRRLDAVSVIGSAMVLKVVNELGLRRVAAHLDVPHTTVRTWWSRFRVRSPTLLARCTTLAVSLDGSSVDVAPHTVGSRAALDVLHLAWQRARTRFGERIGGGGVWSFWSWISGGQALATHTTSPWAAPRGADWMAASPPGGPPA